MPLGASIDLLWIGVGRAFDLIKGSLDLDFGGVGISAEVLDGVGFFFLPRLKFFIRSVAYQTHKMVLL